MSLTTSVLPPTKRPSRSNSVTSSVVTVKKSASVSSRTGESRASYLRNRSTSPDSISRVLHSLNNSRSDYRGRPDGLETKKAGGLNVNRWSHSTSSSLSAIDADLIRKRTSSIRRSTGYGVNASASTTTNQEYKIDARGSPKRSASTGNRSSPLPGSKLAFRDSSNFRIVQDLSQQSQSQSQNSTGLSGSNWEQNSSFNKFGEPVQSLAIQYTTPAIPANQQSGLTNSIVKNSSRGDEKPRSSHGRSKEHSNNRSRDLNNNSGATADPPKTEPTTNNETRSPRRRDMLSRALAKANEAVLLDNAQNVNAAIEAYNEACELLQQVMVRSADLADRKKLSSIKATYSRRIAELHDFDNTFVDLMRPLPEDPPSDEYENPEDFYQEDNAYALAAAGQPPAMDLPLRQESLLPEIFGGDNYILDRSLPPVRNPLPSSRLNVPMDEQYMPPPLSPRPPQLQPESQGVASAQTHIESENHQSKGIIQLPSTSTWLDQSADRSSKGSSRLSSIDYERQDGHLMSAIEAEFDAMNAAVDSAYDDEPDQDSTPKNAGKSIDFIETNRYDHLTGSFLDDDAEAEERFLEDLTTDHDENDAQTHQETITALPRQSDSSGFSGRTWGSSVASTTATTRTTLSTLAETIEPPSHAPPKTALPEPPQSPPNTFDSEKTSTVSRPASSDRPVGLRDRRMSGQSAKQLKIETFARRGSAAQQAKQSQAPHLSQPKEESPEPLKEVPMRSLAPAASFSSSLSGVQPLTPMLSVHSGEMAMDESPATPALTQGGSTDDGNLMDPSPSRHGKMMPPPPGPINRKPPASNLSKGSLSINTGLLEIDSPMTPGSAVFPGDGRKPGSAVTSIPSAISTPGANVLTSTGLGGMYLFDNHVGDLRSPRSPGNIGSEPVPLEPCPESFLLRPFWLMRCLYQALAHPRGGYISSKLFIPKDIWRVRNVKIKALEDKVAQCDLLTAALQKLAKVDTLDANAVLEELQSFETILEQVRMSLSKKLGSDVGFSGSSGVFKGSPAGDDSNDLMSKGGSTSSAAKSIASGWRKLRSKSSSTNLNANSKSESQLQSLTMASLPMTPSSSVATSRSYTNARNRHPPPTPSGLPQLLAPHAYYISALARLFDAVQVVDSIARQVEDPGLKCSSQTHVGLELSVRNAAEFFAFYIIRFVMSDLLMLLDKFLKRGGEWVMS